MDDLQPTISPNIYQQSMDFMITKLLIQRQKPKIGLLPTMVETEAFASCLTHLFLQSLDWYAHPTAAFIALLMEVMQANQATVINEVERSSRFIPSLISHLRCQRKIEPVDIRFRDTPAVLLVADFILGSSAKLVQRIVDDYDPALLQELLRTWSVQLSGLKHQTGFWVTNENMWRLDTLTSISEITHCILRPGKLHIRRQAVKQHLIRYILQTISIVGSMGETRIMKNWTFETMSRTLSNILVTGLLFSSLSCHT